MVKESPLQLAFFVFFIAIAVTYLIPYLRSVVVVPMLFNRYTIVVLPAFIIAIAFAFILIHNRLIQTMMIVTFVTLSLTDLLIVRKYYSDRRIRKTQFREMTEFISENGKGKLYPIVEEKTAWQHGYYLKKYNYNVPVLGGNKENTVNSILLRGTQDTDLDAFWLVGAHGYEPHLNAETQKSLDTAFTLVKEKEFYDTWAQLYLRKHVRKSSSHIMLIPKYFPGQVANYYNADVVAIWAGAITSLPVQMKAGTYNIIISQMGTPLNNIYPQLSFYANNDKIGNLSATETFQSIEFSLKLATDQDVTFKIQLDNDDASNGQDRNAFIKSVIIEKSK
jgi:hypothetical protein